jgi:hypothetical protein
MPGTLVTRTDKKPPVIVTPWISSTRRCAPGALDDGGRLKELVASRPPNNGCQAA